MANVNITQLPSVTTMKGTDEFPIGRDGITTNKVSFSTLIAAAVDNAVINTLSSSPFLSVVLRFKNTFYSHLKNIFRLNN